MARQKGKKALGRINRTNMRKGWTKAHEWKQDSAARKGVAVRVYVARPMLFKHHKTPRYLAYACVGGQAAMLGSKTCGRGMYGTTVQTAVGKALKALGQHVAKRGRK